MDSLYKLTNALSNGTILDSLQPPLPPDWGVCNLATPSYLRNRQSYVLQIWWVHLQGQSELKAIKNFGEKGAWVYPETVQIFWVPPIISGTGKATDFKFCRNIHMVDRNKRP